MIPGRPPPPPMQSPRPTPPPPNQQSGRPPPPFPSPPPRAPPNQSIGPPTPTVNQIARPPPPPPIQSNQQPMLTTNQTQLRPPPPMPNQSRPPPPAPNQARPPPPGPTQARPPPPMPNQARPPPPIPNQARPPTPNSNQQSIQSETSFPRPPRPALPPPPGPPSDGNISPALKINSLGNSNDAAPRPIPPPRGNLPPPPRPPPQVFDDARPRPPLPSPDGLKLPARTSVTTLPEGARPAPRVEPGVNSALRPRPDITPKDAPPNNAGFNTALLAKAQAVVAKKEDEDNDSDDGGWSDDESNRPQPPPLSKLIKPDSNSNIKQVPRRLPASARTSLDMDSVNAIAQANISSNRQSSPMKQPQSTSSPVASNKPVVVASQSSNQINNRSLSPPPSNKATGQPSNQNSKGSPNSLPKSSPAERSMSPLVTQNKRNSVLNIQVPAPSTIISAPVIQDASPLVRSSSPTRPFSPNVRDSVSVQANRQQLYERQSDKIKELEIEVFELKKKLDKAESKLSQHTNMATISTTSNRESLLEKELDEAHIKIENLKREKKTLEMSIEEFQQRLTVAETLKLSQSFKPPISMNEVEDAVKREDREKQLENQLLKVKKDKDKAIKLIIQMIGKDIINDFMSQHAGSPDILDDLVQEFTNVNMNSVKTPPNKTSTNNSMRNIASRSRMDEYFKTVIIDHKRN